MTGEDRFAAVLRGVDRCMARLRSRRAGPVIVALLVAVGAALVVASRNPRPGAPTGMPGGRGHPAMRAAPPPATLDGGPRLPVSQSLERAAIPARRFLHGYLAFSYGHNRASAIRDGDPRLIAAIRRGRVPPAARRRHPRIVALRIVASGPRDAHATATVSEGTSGVRYRLAFDLERRGQMWVVSRLAD